jgi:hypothetical protein
MVTIRFAGDPQSYDFANTTSAVVRDWMADIITEHEMMDLLTAFKIMQTHGMGHVSFLKDLLSDTMYETAVWFREYGIGPDGIR